MAELSKAYQPGEVEEIWYARWLEAGCFTADPASAKPGYSIVIPPPNVTGILHLGHVLNNTIQDILARRARMRGREVLWLPGMDHAGIATQNMVEKSLRKEGLMRHRDELGRNALVERIWEWKEKYGGIIIQQLKKLGVSCDWSRERFTMDPDYSKCVQSIFVDLYQKGLIYRGKRMVNWCPASQTALSDEEVEMRPQNGFLYYFQVEVVEEPGTFLTIATTRPETIPGDTGIAVSPKDPRYARLIGKHVRRPLPLENQAALPIVADEHIDPEFGTGVLKVTPAHDKADFEIGERHGLEAIDIMHPNGVMNDLAGADLAGLERFAARKKAVEILRETGALVKEEPYQNSVGFSERAGVPIEPRLSEQWFLKYPSVDRARECVAKGEMRFFPDRWAKVYDNWLGNIQDWCISRQLWWGHRIPVWRRTVSMDSGPEQSQTDRETQDLLDALLSCTSKHSPAKPRGSYVEMKLSGTADGATACNLHMLPEGEMLIEAATVNLQEIAWLEAHGFTQDPDVLDTWFSSWLWPFATMGWPEKTPALAKFYPTTDLVTGPDILFFWVARMIMAGYEWMDEMPFQNVYFTGIIRDKQGRKMSKTLGNSPDPLDLIAKYGADAVRFGIMRSAPLGLDLKFDETQIEEGRNFTNKLWNACRYRQMQETPVSADAGPLDTEGLSVFAIDIAAKLDKLTADLEAAYAEYSFNQAAALLYEFFWSNYCDLFLEAAKSDLAPGSASPGKTGTLRVMDAVMRRFLMHLHPFTPHITEELWRMMGYGAEGEFLMQQPLPQEPLLAAGAAVQVQERAAAVYESAGRIRNLKASCGLASNRSAVFILKPSAEVPADQVETLRLLAQAGGITVQPEFQPGEGIAATLTPLGEVFLPLEGLIDVEAERARLGKELQKTEEEISKVEAKLGSESFTARAPEAVVADHRQRREDFLTRRTQLTELIKNLN